MPEMVLSLCIPTYNRADLLAKILSELVLENSFKAGKTEICISDNASTDNTEWVVRGFMDKYKNIVYNRNIKNTETIDDNFPKAGALASGTFIKFLNDYASFVPGELDRIIEFIEKNKENKHILFFSNNSLPDKTKEIIYCDSLDSFVQQASYWSTWLLTAGFWREDFISMPERDRYTGKFMWCPDNYLRLVSSGRKAVIYNSKFCTLYPLSSKGGYNLFEVFVNNYLSLYIPYLKIGKLSSEVFNKEKMKLYKYYLLPVTRKYINSVDVKYSFKIKGAFNILFRSYWYYPYFYFGLLKFILIFSIDNPITNSNNLYRKLKKFLKPHS